MCCILSGVGLHAEIRKFGELNFVKTGLKSKFGVNPQFFSHALCLYITRFPPGGARGVGTRLALFDEGLLTDIV